MKSLSSKIYGAAFTVGLALLVLAGPGLFALLFPVNALADTVAPPTYSTTLTPGQSATITKTVTINAGTPTSAKVDVFFLADTTGSMGSAIQNVRDGVAAIMAATSGLGDVAYAVGEYKDVGDPFVYRLNQDITKVTADVQTGINAWVAGGGGDTPEADLYGLYEAANITSWRPGSTRILIWFGDAESHDPAGPTNVTEAQATAALVAQTIKVLALDLGALNSTGQAQRIATATGGQYYSGVNVTQIVNVIQSAIISSFATYSTVSLDTAAVPPGVTVNIVPPSFTGTFDRSTDHIFNFSVKFTAVSPGSYSFPIPVLVDGGTMATEQDNIQVAALATGLAFPLPRYTPYNAPVSAVMDNSVLERTPIKFYLPGDLVKAFNGETGEKQFGVKYLDPFGQFWAAYKNSAGTGFFPPSAAGVRPLNYINGPWLSYAGNPGYNYQVPAGTQVLATADGKLYQATAATDPVNGAGYDVYANSYIDHQNGWYSWYLYTPLDSAILAQISLNGYAQVTKGQPIGKTLGDHLHFEVRHNGFDHANVVDPYKLGLWLSSRMLNPGPQMLLLLE